MGAVSALAVQAADDGPSGPALALAGSTLRIPPGWSASLFVGHPEAPSAFERPSAAVPAVPPVNARVARRLSKTARIELEVFNMLDRRVPGVDAATGVRLFGAPGGPGDSLPHSAEPRTFVLSFKKTF